MTRTVGTVARGIRTPIVKEGDDIVSIVVDSIVEAQKSENLVLKDKDVIGITESLIARAQGNYATTSEIAEDIKNKYPGDTIGIVFPILSRNRFSVLLKGIAESGKKLVVLLSYPSDEVGNHLMSLDTLDELKINPYDRVLTESEYREFFGSSVKHEFTGIDYVDLYKCLGDNIEIILANDPRVILNYTKDVLVSDIHTRKRTKRLLREAGANTVYGLDEILNTPINGSGYNEEYGLLGSNLASDHEVKLFTRDCQKYVEEIKTKLDEIYNIETEVMVYGDGAFKDPIGKIWELADPVVSPGFTAGLKGTPNEIKLKYIADTELSDLSPDEALKAVTEKIYAKGTDQLSQEESIGTTPRQITDLLGSLCDLTSGSGDKGTPVVLVQGYFDSLAAE
ncbi:MAG: F420-0--gamma-glutamyl ligase [Tissierellia bacterium]|nr:F420-0--gamma-glutamyl ligase [Tissierellia bacterium]